MIPFDRSFPTTWRLPRPPTKVVSPPRATLHSKLPLARCCWSSRTPTTSSPYLVVVFKESYGVDEESDKITNYYVNESVGIACGMFIAALHTMGLVTLTHTPSPMGFLSELLNRPPNEKPYILFPVGYPAEGAMVPDLKRKTFEEVVQLNNGIA